MGNYIVINGKRAELTKEQLKALVIEKEVAELRKSAWIPVKERLPRLCGEYLVTVLFEDKSTMSCFAWYHAGVRTDILWELDDGQNADKEVIAWMPLPEPYTESVKQ